MTNKNNFQIPALSNLLAAFGGGIILGKGIACIRTEYLDGGSILAFFTGTVLGLIFLQSIPISLSKLLTRFFSFFSSLTSIILLILFNEYSSNGVMTSYAAIIFFMLLSIRFGFWFYSRVRRAAEAAKIQHRVAWVEMGYYIGIISGLVLWRILNIPLSFTAALIIDAILQLLAGTIDILTPTIDNDVPLTESNFNSAQINSSENSGSWRVITTLTALTIGTQAILFSLVHDVSPSIGSYILAVFYTGVAVAAFIFKKYSIKLNWSKLSGIPSLQCGGITLKLSLFSAILCIFVSGSILVVKQFHPYLASDLITPKSMLISFLFLVFIAAFIYELIALSVIDRVNIDCPQNQYTIIIKSYGIMGTGTAVALWMLGITTNYYELFGVSVVAIVIGTMAIMNGIVPGGGKAQFRH